MNNAYTKILLLAALLLGGCAENEPIADATMHEIAVGPAIASDDASRATPVTSLADLNGLEISVKRNGTGRDYFTDVATQSGDVFSFSTPHYWLPGAPLDFYAYTQSPHISNLSIENGAVNFSYSGSVDGVTTDGADILTGMAFGLEYADTQGGVVPIKLSHALSLIEFAVAYEDDAEGNRTSKIGNDIIITGTDGLWDNISDSVLLEIINSNCREDIVDRVASVAKENSMNDMIDSPFAVRARENGMMYMGGKPDDITVVVTVIRGEEEDEERRSINSTNSKRSGSTKASATSLNEDYYL